MLDEQLEQRLEPALGPPAPRQPQVGVVGVERRPPAARVGVDDREADLVLVGVEVEEQLLDLVHDLGDPGVAAIDLVDDHDDGQARLERLAQHEPGLGQRPLGRVDEQQHAVDHREAPLHLAAEVGVARRVDDVDLHPAVPHRRVLGEDRDPLLALEVGRVHDPVDDLLVRGERAGLAQHRVDERGLAVVDVGDDRHVAEVGAGAHGRRAFRWKRGTPQSTGAYAQQRFVRRATHTVARAAQTAPWGEGDGMKLQQGDVAVVTGAASGIGFALAERFATAGLHVVAADVDPAALDDAVARLAEHGGEVLGVPTDVSREDAGAGARDRDARAVRRRPRGVQQRRRRRRRATRGSARSRRGSGSSASTSGVSSTACAPSSPTSRSAGRGHIVNTASMAGLVPGFNPSYDATKHAVVALTEDLYHAMRDAGLPVGVSVLCPGWVRTQIFDSERNWPDHLASGPSARSARR